MRCSSRMDAVKERPAAAPAPPAATESVCGRWWRLLGLHVGDRVHQHQASGSEKALHGVSTGSVMEQLQRVREPKDMAMQPSTHPQTCPPARCRHAPG
jgi:hypothetical protein